MGIGAMLATVRTTYRSAHLVVRKACEQQGNSMVSNESKTPKLSQEELKRLREGDTSTSYEDSMAFKRLMKKMDAEKPDQK